MSDLTFQLIALAIYFAAMVGIGLYAFRQTKDHEDYMLGGRNLSPGTAALSAGASDMSGWLMMGLPGAIYISGLIEAWIAIGLTIGAYLNWRFVAPRLRAYTEVAKNSITIPSFFENRLRDRSRLLRIVSGVVILIFFTFYISSGMVAGGVFFEGSFGGDYLVGMLLVTGVTLLYTLFGGFLGASFTDVVQGLMMMLALVLIPVVAIFTLGGFGGVSEAIVASGIEHTGLIPGDGLDWVTTLAIVSALAWGLGYFGQPHIIVRFMAMRDPGSAKAGRRIGMSWMTLSMVGAVTAGIVGVAYIQRNGIELSDPEAVTLVMAQVMFHPIVSGFILAAVLAAIMSTMSSQLIVCSSALVEDLYMVIAKRQPSARKLVILGRTCVFAVAVVAGVLAFDRTGTILSLVGFAWAGFGAAFGPAVILSLYWRKLTNWGALAGMVAGTITVFAWSALGTDLYEIVPGVVVSLIASVVVSLLTYKRDPEIDAEFDQAKTLVVKKADAVEDEKVEA
ncbi:MULTISPECIES: sodium/proline symporter PutP [unclassified Pseudoclavibacter]|uniref:sodium/proline symporter PutP n=1 Tax=unclassified Pseudoclavibacter TaxID=2615177 RepID=UPI000CE77C9A|nr:MULTISPECIES: sodium/proline symporter PutP [unclassified Pseudoclavibacter]PPF74723.1 sodium/proline symporter PutP [Pseudoclavibacter sp. Z016]PPG05291.1 sodium/proline symporter PutP [Pseudoclavibacter sp. RFBI5]